MTMGLVMVGATETNKSVPTLDNVTPVARLTTEQENVVLPADSPSTTMGDVQRLNRDVTGRAGLRDRCYRVVVNSVRVCIEIT